MDHNYVQELVNTGHITDDEARTHPRRNIITRALGIDPSVRVDAWTLPIVRGDRFVLCSDGLSDEVHDNEIHQIVTTITDPQAAADELVAAANRAGGRDNISAIVVDVIDGLDPPAPDEELDIEPVWETEPAAGTWALDDPTPAEPTAFEDLAALASSQGRARHHAGEHAAGDHRGGARDRPAQPPPQGRRVHRRRCHLGCADPDLRHRRRVRPARLLRGVRRGR